MKLSCCISQWGCLFFLVGDHPYLESTTVLSDRIMLTSLEVDIDRHSLLGG